MHNKPYTLEEEILSAFFHILGMVLAIASMSVLVAFSVPNALKITASVIFSSTMLFLYSASSMYHAIGNLKTKAILKKFDHIAIYFLIAGTYTPFALINLKDSIGWWIFGIIWFLAICGTILKLILPPSGTKAWSIGLYLLMGWLILFAGKAFMQNVNHLGLKYLLLGGIFYTVGILFYVWKSKKYTHAIWHAFVLLGTIMHFFAILWGSILG